MTIDMASVMIGIVMSIVVIRTLLIAVIIRNKGFTYETIKKHYERRLKNRLYLIKGRYVELTDEDVTMIKETIKYTDTVLNEKEGVKNNG